jgi:hypothetical protein
MPGARDRKKVKIRREKKISCHMCNADVDPRG